MNKYLYTAILAVVFFSSTIVKSADKIAVVNIYSIFQKSPQRNLVIKKLENEFRERAAELQHMENDLQNDIQYLQHNNYKIKVSDRDILEKSIIKKREIFSNKAQIFERDNRRRQTEERNKILGCIYNVLKKIAVKNGYDIVIDAKSVAYANNIKDITSDVLEQVK